MGYTHYFKNKKSINEDDWNQLCDSFQQILDALPANIQVGAGGLGEEPKNKIINYRSGEICFNGKGSQSHETMLIHQKKQKESFNFCKTAHKPYDLAVCSLLILIENIAPYSHEISSDGDLLDWKEAHRLCCNTFKKSFKLPESLFEYASQEDIEDYKNGNSVYDNLNDLNDNNNLKTTSTKNLKI